MSSVRKKKKSNRTGSNGGHGQNRSISIRLTDDSVEMLRTMKSRWGTPYATTIQRTLAWLAIQDVATIARILEEGGRLTGDDE